MGSYYIPRDVKGETRLFKVFSVKALIYTIVAAIPGLILFAIFNSIKLTPIGIFFLAFFALMGFIIGTFRIPNLTFAPIFRICNGEKIDDIIMRAIKFQKQKKIYIYGKEKK